jgi:hypothetical protein
MGNLGKDRQMAFPPFTTSYSKLETAMLRLHGIPADKASAFRSRFGMLQRDGLFGADRPGKGKKIVYAPQHFHRTIVAFELVQAGVAPAVILRLFNEHWDRLSAIVMKAEKAVVRPAERDANDVVLILGLNLIDDTIKSINGVTRDRIGEIAMLALDSRLLLVNLSAQLRRFHENLAVLHLQPDELFEMAERARLKKDGSKIGKSAKRSRGKALLEQPAARKDKVA